MVIAAFSGVWLIERGLEPVQPPQPSAAQAFTAGPAPGRAGLPADSPARRTTRATTELPPPGGLPPADPVRVAIPAIGVDAPVMRLGLGADHSLDVPPPGSTNKAGWYKDGAAPGSRGTSVMAGHVDDAHGPAVFYALGALKKGSRVEVTRTDGVTAVFAVDAVEVYENDAFPDAKVYGPAPRPELRLITCGGGFSPQAGYRGNVVAFAHLTGMVRTGAGETKTF
ncbi:class F sortase [Streptomyces sp. NBC_00083]|uniref:class F sortase n=1 Tax=Streptomyces sp. NBC_00083 TaxID=2975647 RepID=UPI00225BE204|nr:class F sortase [Streptomyces sp. NBC_00083]MCX5382621.1 class F sortase [Streptomyces sp. NBC_00083]